MFPEFRVLVQVSGETSDGSRIFERTDFFWSGVESEGLWFRVCVSQWHLVIGCYINMEHSEGPVRSKCCGNSPIVLCFPHLNFSFFLFFLPHWHFTVILHCGLVLVIVFAKGAFPPAVSTFSHPPSSPLYSLPESKHVWRWCHAPEYSQSSSLGNPKPGRQTDISVLADCYNRGWLYSWRVFWWVSHAEPLNSMNPTDLHKKKKEHETEINRLWKKSHFIDKQRTKRQKNIRQVSVTEDRDDHWYVWIPHCCNADSWNFRTSLEQGDDVGGGGSHHYHCWC